MLNFGIIGFGYWGPNVVRNLNLIEGAQVKKICDQNPQVLEEARALYPSAEVIDHSDQVIEDPEIDVVAIVTPLTTHYSLAKKALSAGKHVFIEKPFTSTVSEAEELVDLASKKSLKIMVDHTFLFTGAVEKIKELMDEEMLGKLLYYDSTRVSLGLLQKDANVVWDLAPHDFSILDYVVKERPKSLTAYGVDHMGGGYENIAFITLFFESKLIAHFNVNWLSPVKIRSALIGGEKRMLVWDDLKADEKIKIYDRGVDVQTREGFYKLLVDYRSGDMVSPRIDPTEALKKELIYFVHCIKQNQEPFNNGASGLRIVKLLEATDRSLRNKGAVVEL